MTVNDEKPAPKAGQQFYSIYWRGLAMGAADIVPGVSGGTIALITGIYDRFIDSLKAVGSWASVQQLMKGQFKAFFERTDFIFLLTLFAGIFTSIVGLSKIITSLMTNYPHPVWASFLGLVLASAVVMFRDLWRAHRLQLFSALMLVIGFFLALWLGRMTPQDFQVQSWHFFAGGAIAICAMILPGVSGSFLLLMMGLYGAVLTAIHELEFFRLGLFAAGCGVGLLSFSHLLSWCLHRFPAASHAFLIGLMLGAVEKLWPWKQTLETRIKSNGDVVPLLEKAISPFKYEEVVGASASFELAAFTFTLAFLCILVLGCRDSNNHE